jgi:SAM-dependent methyltransferase
MSGSFLRRLKAWFKRGGDNRLADDDLSWLWPPRDIHCVEAWDRHWYNQINHGLGPGMFDLFCQEEHLISAMRRRGYLTVLCAGNGISQEPRALAAAGFHVTALDSSRMALQIAQQCHLTPKQLEHFYPPEFCAPGGSLEFVVGDLRDEAICSGPFDVVIERCTLQLFPLNECACALDALAHRLREDGVFRSHCHNGGWRPDQPRDHLFEDLFREKGWAIENGYQALRTDGRVAWLSLSTG